MDPLQEALGLVRKHERRDDIDQLAKAIEELPDVDRRTVVLGSLAMERLPGFRAPVAGS